MQIRRVTNMLAGFRVFLLAGLGLLAADTLVQAQQKRPLQIEDHFQVKQVTALELSPDGRELVYALKEANLSENRYVQTLWRIRTDGASQPARLTNTEEDSAPQWAPNGKKIAFLSSRDGTVQIWIQAANGGPAQKITSIKTEVESFQWSPDGTKIAFITASTGQGGLEETIAKGEKGVVVFKSKLSAYQLLRNQAFRNRERAAHLLVLDFPGGKVRELTEQSHVLSFAWSPDSEMIAVAEKASPDPVAPSNITLYGITESTRRILLEGSAVRGKYVATEYGDPFWSPDGKQIGCVYTDTKDRFASSGRVGIYALEHGQFSLITSEESLELYAPKFFWLQPEAIYLEDSHRAERHLVTLSPRSGALARVVGGDADDSQFSFSADGRKAAFVRQTLQSAPETYISDFPFGLATKLTSVNQHFQNIGLPRTERVRWTAPDGTEVEGWIYVPPDFREEKRYPLLVFVHGGPTGVFGNRFEPYWSGWPYPFRLFAQRGYLVFVPNYRGTGTYGKSFRQTPEDPKEAMSDILAGISWLARRGIADPECLGILGHSHGAWLGPYTMAHNRVFKAASFAEGPSEFISVYHHVPGWLDLWLHEYYWGGSPYDNLQRYIEISPIFSFRGLQTATLLEYGEQSMAISGLGYLSALWRQETPHEMVIYPRTVHNLASPRLQLDSITRNLEWFDYWLLGEEDPTPSKAEQYARWGQMRDKLRVRGKD